MDSFVHGAFSFLPGMMVIDKKIKTGQSYVNRNAPYKIIEYIYYLDIGRIGAATIVVLYVELESSEPELPSNAYAKLCPSHV